MKFVPAQNADRHRQVQCRPFLFHVGRGEIDQQRVGRKRIPGIDNRPADALDRLLHGRLRKADNRGFAQPALADIHLDFAEQRVDAHEDEAMYFCQHLLPRNRQVLRILLWAAD